MVDLNATIQGVEGYFLEAITFHVTKETTMLIKVINVAGLDVAEFSLETI